MSRDRKPKECENPACSKSFLQWSSTQVACSITCAGVVAAARATKREQRKRDLAERAEMKAKRATKREALLKLMTVKELYGIAQRAVNAFVRLRDLRKGCISCETGRVDDAGHLFPIGSKWLCHPLRLDPRLINGQCRKCNSFVGGGNVHGYLAGLKARYGHEYVDECYAIKASAERGEMPLLGRDEILAKAAEFNRMARDLRKAAA